MSEESGNSQGSPLKSERGNTTISNSVVSQIAGIAAQEVEKVQMGGGTSQAVGGLLQSVTGGSSSGGSYSRGVTVEVGEEETVVDLTMTVGYETGAPRPGFSFCVLPRFSKAVCGKSRPEVRKGYRLQQ